MKCGCKTALVTLAFSNGYLTFFVGGLEGSEKQKETRSFENFEMN